MKKQILATLVLVISVFATANAGTKSEADNSSSKKITVNTGFTRLVVEGNVDVVLFEDGATSEIRTFGNKSDLASTSISQVNGVLTIKNSSKKGEKVLIYVPVSKLSVIEAAGDSKVSSASMLQSQQLTLVVKGACKLNIQSAGNIDIVEGADVEMVVERKTTTSAPAVQS